MSTKENQDDTDPRIMIAQMEQAWSDARSYTGNIWQIAALCLTVIALSLNIADTSALVEPLLVLVLLFTSFLASGGVLTIQWLRYNITYRVVYIREIEEKLADLQEEHKVTPSSHLFGLEKGPLAYLFAILVVTTEILFIYLAYATYLFLISLSVGYSVSTGISVIILVSSVLPFSGHVIYRMRDLRKREKETAKDWKARFRENLWEAVEELRLQEHVLEVKYEYSFFKRERESGFNVTIRAGDLEFIFITRTSYWTSKKKWEDARSFEKRIIFIATPHHERFIETRHGVFVISSAASVEDLKKYLLDGVNGKL